MPKFVFPAIAITLAVLILVPLFTSGPMPKTKDAPDGVTPKASRPTSTDRSRGDGTSTADENPLSPAVEVATLPISGRGPSGATRLTVISRFDRPKHGETGTAEIGIRLDGMPALWLGKAPAYSDLPKEMEFSKLDVLIDHPLANNLKGCEAAWISRSPLLLHLVTEAHRQGSGLFQERDDYIIALANQEAQVVLHEGLLIRSRNGCASLIENSRKVYAIQSEHHFSMRIQDQSTSKCCSSDHPYALYSRSNGNPDVANGWYWGCVELKRTREWQWSEASFKQTRDEATYRVQPGDKWEDIATYFFNDRTKITQLKSVNAQSTSARPTSNRWIKLPKGASLDQLGTIGEATSDEDKRRWVLGASLNR